MLFGEKSLSFKYYFIVVKLELIMHLISVDRIDSDFILFCVFLAYC